MKSYVEISKSNNEKIEIINFLKGFSILTITIMHVMYFMTDIPSKISTLSSIGGSGVHVFFVCSGIGLYMSYMKQKITYITFLKKKFIKIYIPYIIVILISFAIPGLYRESDKIIALMSHIFLFKMFVPKYEDSFGIQFWYISTLIQLYLLFIPMCKLKSKLNNKLFCSIFLVISIMWWILCYYNNLSNIRVWGSFCLQYIWEFALGFVVAEKLYEKKEYKIKNYILIFLAIIGIGIQASTAIYSERLKIFNDIPALIGYSSLALALSNITIIKKICSKLSMFSYEYYLLHMLVFYLVFTITNPNGILYQTIIALIAMIMSIIISYFYHKIIVKLMKHKRT